MIAPHDEPSLVGRILAGRYDVLALLGTGGMGAVYRARDRELDELVALKVIRAELARDPAAVERFRSEVKLARRVTHANVARTFELGSADGVMFCTMELVDGEPLAERLRRTRRLEVSEAVAIACALLDGLAAAHEVNVIHRDIKPDNVLLAHDGRVVVADFGVAAMLATGNEASGTPAYMAPEQATGQPPTPASDIYSVGIVLYEALTGRRAFTGTAIEILADKLERDRVAPGPDEAPAELSRVIARATARELGARFATARELRRALAPWARSPRPPTTPWASASLAEVATVVLLEPHGDDVRLHIAQAVQEAIAVELGKQPGLRVLTRTRADREPDAVFVEFTATTTLSVAVRGPVALGLVLPLEADQTATAARAVSAAILAATRAAVSNPTPVDELVMRAHYLMTREHDHVPEVVRLLEQACAIAPDDARVAAALAVAHVRSAFFGNADDRELARAGELARVAFANAPELAESHLALGHVELHSGDPAIAAGHYRKALARSPHIGEAHEYLGRLLLEAGYVDLGLARLEESLASALAMSGSIRTRWDIARAHALEGRWDEYDRIVSEVTAAGGGRSLLRARYGWWRGDLAPTVELRGHPDYRLFEPGAVDALTSSFLDGTWPTSRDVLVRWAHSPAANRRRRMLMPQLAAEAAGFSNDAATCLSLVECAVDQGLFDLHWVDKCPLLACARALPQFAVLRARVRGRAEAILDAFYGDHHVATSETALAPSVLAERRP